MFYTEYILRQNKREAKNYSTENSGTVRRNLLKMLLVRYIMFHVEKTYDIKVL